MSEQTSDGSIQALKQNIEWIEPLLDMEGEWLAHETPVDGMHSGVFHFLVKKGAVERVRKEFSTEKGHFDGRVVWKWKPEIKQQLQQYRDSLNRFSDYADSGCSHHVHISHHPKKDCFTCKFCESNPEYSRETVEEGL